MRNFILVFATLFMACAHQPSNSVKAGKSVAKNTRTPITKKESREAKEVAHDKAMIMATKKSGRTQIAMNAVPQKKRIELKLKPGLSKSISENALFDEMQARYDSNDEIGFQSRYQAMQQRYPKSAHLNEAHYMSGLLALNNKNYGGALRAFDTLIKKSPRSPQAPKAMFAKAITYKRMNLGGPATSLLKEVQTKYPKTLEAERASIELKIQEKRFQ